MHSLFQFFLAEHDTRLVVLAGIVCLIACYVCINLLRHARASSARMRKVWLGVGAIAVGFGIWSTHFVAMLAHRPGFELSYDLLTTAASLLVAIGVSGLGLGIAVYGKHRSDALLGGAVIGVGISAMHYLGMAGLVLGGTIVWDPATIATSILASISLGAVSLWWSAKEGKSRQLGGALGLTAAICTLHFTAMAAADFSQCFSLPSVAQQVDAGSMSLLVALANVVIFGAAIGSVALDEADRRRSEREIARQLQDAERLNRLSERLELALGNMSQGLCLFDSSGHLELCNQQTSVLLGLPLGRKLEGTSFQDICRLAVAGPAAVENDATSEILRQHKRACREGGTLAHTLGNRVIQVTHNPIENGGWVTTIDDITERRRSETAIAHLAMHDVLTDLPNRASFERNLSHALEQVAGSEDHLAVLQIDLNNFKEVNDSHGHAAGDALLVALAVRLKGTLELGEAVARIGGDEFAAFKRFTRMDELQGFLDRLEKALSDSTKLGELVIAGSGSIGVSVFPQDGIELSKLMSNADLAMYRAKKQLEHHICFYEPEMDERSRNRRAMARDLWSAIENNEFRLVYQVQTSVGSGLVVGYETLLRWDRGGSEPVSPAEFIPVAEECGAINQIGAWVIEAACRQAADWLEPHKVAVNISAIQLSQPDLVHVVDRALKASGLPPNRLELEITETAIIADKSRALSILRQLKEMGVSIAMDDFGTGYSSLETLRSFPFDKIKLDRSFVQEVEHDEQAKAIVRAVVALGRTLRVPILAEGVETAEQLEVLKREGCSEAQGFLLGRPTSKLWWETPLALSA